MKKKSSWGPGRGGLATPDHPPSSIRRLLHHTPEVVINSISEVPRLATPRYGELCRPSFGSQPACRPPTSLLCEHGRCVSARPSERSLATGSGPPNGGHCLEGVGWPPWLEPLSTCSCCCTCGVRLKQTCSSFCMGEPLWASQPRAAMASCRLPIQLPMPLILADSGPRPRLGSVGCDYRRDPGGGTLLHVAFSRAEHE